MKNTQRLYFRLAAAFAAMLMWLPLMRAESAPASAGATLLLNAGQSGPVVFYIDDIVYE